MGRRAEPNARTKRMTRREKAQVAWTDKDNYTPRGKTPDPAKAPYLNPKNDRQRDALWQLTDKSVVFLTGSAGTGKSMLAAYHAATLLFTKKIDKLWLVRPAVGVGKTIGLLPGTEEEKLAPYFKQIRAHLGRFLGPATVDAYFNAGKIEMQPVEYMRGMSMENCMVIAEEAQNFTAEEFEMMLTRLGDNCTQVYTGDTKQHDLRGDSGMDQTLKLISRMLQTQPEYMTDEDMDHLDDNIGVVKFLPADVVRSGLCKSLVTMYFHQ